MTTLPENATSDVPEPVLHDAALHDAEVNGAEVNGAEIVADSAEVVVDSVEDEVIQVFDTMNAAQIALYNRLQAFDIDNVEDSLSFSQRLARENSWSRTFALRVIEDYRRFAFLALSADHPITPSDQVDQAWHLHLSYSRSYWEDFCSNTLKTPLHHEPTRGGEAESEKFDDWYEQTLASYEHFFGEAPSEDIWPPATIRFGRDSQFVWVNTQQKWVIPKLPISREVMGSIVAVLVVGVWFYWLQNSAHSVPLMGGILVMAISAISSYSFIQLGAGFLEALHKPRGAGCSYGGGGCGGCGGGCCGCGGGGCGGC